MHTVSVWVNSGSSATIESIGDEDQQSVCDFAVVGAPGVVGLSDSRLAEFIGAIQGFDIDSAATEQSVGSKLGLLGICIINKWDIDSSGGEVPTRGDMQFWHDTKHIKPIGEVVLSACRCIELIESRDTELEAIIRSISKGNSGDALNTRKELVHELGLLVRHLTWVAQNRQSATVSMFLEF